MRLLANRQVMLVNLGSAILGLTSFQSMQLWSIVLQQPTVTGIGMGVSATLAGLILLPKTLIALISGPMAGWLISRYNGRTAMSLDAAIMALAWTVLSIKHDTLMFLACVLTLLGFGMSMFYAGIPIMISRHVPMERTSEASGMMIVIRVSAMGIGAQIVANMLDSSTIPVDGANYPDETALFRVLTYVIVGSLLMLFVSLLMSREQSPDDGKETRVDNQAQYS